MTYRNIDMTYRAGNTGGILANRVVKRGANPREVFVADSENDAGVIGISTHNQVIQGKMIGVRRTGLINAVASGPVSVDDEIVADTGGKVKRATRPACMLGSVPSDNAVRFEWISFKSFSIGIGVETVQATPSQLLSWRFTNSNLSIKPAITGGNVTTTANQLVTALNADPVLSRFVRTSHVSGSDGTGVLDIGSAVFEGFEGINSVIGKAEDAATQDGDLIRVILSL